MEVRHNGELAEIASSSVKDLLVELGLEQKKIAVELNRQVLRRETFAETLLNVGDEIEIIHFVGGG